jgi:hypothetical protein
MAEVLSSGACEVTVGYATMGINQVAGCGRAILHSVNGLEVSVSDPERSEGGREQIVGTAKHTD